MMNRADRRFRKRRKVARAAKMLRAWGMDPQHAPLWADNMAKCSCFACRAPTRPEVDYNVDNWVEWAEATREWE